MLDWLQEEFNWSQTKVTENHIQWIQKNIGDPEILNKIGGFGIARIETNKNTFDITNTGEPALIIPVYTAHLPEAESTLIDLIALPSKEPEKFYQRRNDAVFLGEDELQKAQFWHQPVDLYKTPLTWLKNGAKGSCVLNWAEACHTLIEFNEINVKLPVISEIPKANIEKEENFLETS